MFFTDSLSWKLYIAALDGKPNTILHKLSSHSSPDPRLVNVWLDLREFSRSANIAYQTGRRIRGELFQETIVSVQYRLLALEHEHKERDKSDNPVPVQETMARLGMLAFCATAFLQPKGVRADYPRFAARLRECLESAIPSQKVAELETTKIFWRMRLWLLYISYISVLAGTEHEALVVSGVSGALLALRLASWKEVRDVLMEHVWIDWIDGKVGMDLTEKALVYLQS